MVKMSIKVTLPSKNLLPQNKMTAVVDALEKALDEDVAKEVSRGLEKTVEKWSGPPTFNHKVKVNARSMVLHVYPDGPNAKKWQRVSSGVGARVIVPKRASKLIFKRNYAPHTTAAGAWGGSGRRYGDTVYAKSVRWPGIKARNFSEKVKDNVEKSVTRIINKRISRSLR